MLSKPVPTVQNIFCRCLCFLFAPQETVSSGPIPTDDQLAGVDDSPVNGFDTPAHSSVGEANDPHASGFQLIPTTSLAMQQTHATGKTVALIACKLSSTQELWSLVPDTNTRSTAVCCIRWGVTCTNDGGYPGCTPLSYRRTRTPPQRITILPQLCAIPRHC